MADVIPFDRKQRIEASLRPADITEAQDAVAMLAKALPIMPSIQDPPAFKAIMAERLASFPADVLLAAVNQAMDDFEEMPSIKAMRKICERFLEPRRAELRAIEAAQRRKEQTAAEAEREAQREAKRQAAIKRLRQVEARARKRFGDDAPRPGDVQLAASISGNRVVRDGRPVTWLDALDQGEPWAAKFCRLMALAARARDAVNEGRARWDAALDLLKVLITDEAEVRHLVEQIERRHGGPGELLTESFWTMRLWRVHRACGCDVPADVVFPEDQAAALKRLDLSALADVRAVIDRQNTQEWAAKRAAKEWLVPAPQVTDKEDHNG